LVVEFYGVIHAIEQAQKMSVNTLWLECDFSLVCVVFTARTNIPWMLCNRWNTCLNYCGKIKFRVSYIFREGNVCPDKFANLDFIHREYFHWYNRLPSSLFLEFFINRYRLPIVLDQSARRSVLSIFRRQVSSALESSSWDM